MKRESQVTRQDIIHGGMDERHAWCVELRTTQTRAELMSGGLHEHILCVAREHTSYVPNEMRSLPTRAEMHFTHLCA